MRRSWLVVLSWCVGFVWAVGLILNAVHSDPSPVPTPSLPQPPPATATVTEARSIEPPIEVATPAKALYAGNTNTHRFHLNTCRYADCPNCQARFATRKEAIEAGYRPCGICDP